MRIATITTPHGLTWWVFEDTDETLKVCRPCWRDGRRIMDQLREVTPRSAEVLTGLHMPAAMDRLRELVHEL